MTKNKELTVREHLKNIQAEGGKARWANVSPEERSAQARKAVEARWAKKRAEEAAATSAPAASKTKRTPKKASKKK
jgi:hypothetical protein